MAGLIAPLAGLKVAILRHSPSALRQAGIVTGFAAIAGTWAAVLFAGSDTARSQLLMLVVLATAAGWLVGPSLAAGTGVLRPEFFRLLPLARYRLAAALLGTGFVGLGAPVSLAVLAALGAHAVALAPATLLVAVPGVLLALAVAVSLSRLFFAVLGAAMHSRFGVELSGVQYGALVAAIFTGWMGAQAAVDTIPALVRDGLPPGAFPTTLAALPTSWPVHAVDAAAAGRWAPAIGWLAALAALAAVLVAATTAVLAPPAGRPPATRTRRRRRTVAGRPLLPATPLGAVVGKELRLWRRDPWRRLELRTMIWAAVISATAALVTGHGELAPYAGLIAGFGAALSALNLYGQDGTACWLTVVGAGPGTTRADVRGRQLAVVLMTAPPALALTVLLVLATGSHHLWPQLLALQAVLLGGGSGLGLLLSVVAATPGVDPQHRVGPNDAGDVTFQVWTALLATPVLLVPVAVLAGGVDTTGAAGLGTVVAGVGYGALLAWWLGRVAHRRLAARLPETFTRIRYGKAVAAQQAWTGQGWLDRLERNSALQNEERRPVGS